MQRADVPTACASNRDSRATWRRRRQHGPGRARGFTIVEMVIVVVIAGVLAALAVPEMQTLFKNNARTARLNSMITAFNLARSEAVKLNQSVSICPSGTPAGAPYSAGNANSAAYTACNPTSNGEFEDGWIIFTNPNEDGTVDAGERVLRSFATGMNEDNDKRTYSTFKAVAAVGGASIALFTYRGTGFPAGGIGNSHIVYCDSRGQTSARGFTWSTTGQPRMITSDADADGLPDIGGQELQCCGNAQTCTN